MNLPAILECLHPSGEAAELSPLETLCPQLLDLLNAQGIGVNGCDDGAPFFSWFAPTVTPPAPWCPDARQVCDARRTWSALAHRDDAGVWLACADCEPRSGTAVMVWLYQAAPHAWSDAAVSLWPTVAALFVRRLARQCEAALAQERLRRNLEQTAVLTSRLSHDFGNYLTGILGFTELSLTKVASDSLSHRYLKEVLQAAQQGAAWVRRLAWFCRRGHQSIWPSELTSVIDVIQAPLPAEQSARWRLTIPPDLPLLAIDGASLQIAIEELTKNADAACNGTAALTIAARPVDLTASDCQSLLGAAQPGRFVEVTVADDGPGFSEEARAKIFHEPFYSTQARHRGLGFLMLYGIARRFDGGVRLAPSEPGRGACVQFYLPAVPLGAATRTDAPHVLVVHPDRLVTASVRRLLEGEGYRVSIAPTSIVALTMYQASEPTYALVLAESILPQLSGFDLARRILDRDAKARFVFLHTSASFHGSTEQEMLKRFELLRWPVAPAAFLQAVATALRQSTK